MRVFVLGKGGNMYGVQRALFAAVVIALVVVGIIAIAPSIRDGYARLGSYGPDGRYDGYYDRRDRDGTVGRRSK